MSELPETPEPPETPTERLASSAEDGSPGDGDPDDRSQEVAPHRVRVKGIGRIKVGDARIKEAVIAFRGNLAEAARHLKLSVVQLRKRVNAHPELKATLAEVRAEHGVKTGLGLGRVRQPALQQVTDDQIEAALRQYSVCVDGAYALPARSLGITTEALTDRVKNSEALQWVIEQIKQEMLGEAVVTWRAMTRGVKIEGRSPHWAAVNKALEVLGGLVARTEVTGLGGGPMQWRDVSEERRRAAVELRLHEERAA